MRSNSRDTNVLTNLGILFILMLANAVVAYFMLSDGHDWRGDFAMYVSQGQALLNSSTQELYEINKFSMDNSDADLGPYLYQFGFPVLLSGILAIFGVNFFAMKALCSAGLVLSIPILYKLIRGYFTSAFLPFLIVTSIVFHSSYVIFCDSVLSDLPFFFFSLLALFMMQRKATLVNQFALGLVIYFSYSIRDIGIVLLPTLIVYQVHSYFLHEALGLNKRILAIPYLVFAFLFVVGIVILPAGQENHLRALFSEVSWQSISENLDYYRVLITRFFHLGNHPSVFFFILISLMAVGIISLLSRMPHLIIYVFFTLLILVVWPYKQGVRFLFPVLPFLMLFAVKGISTLFNLSEIGKKLNPIVLVAAFAYLMFFNFEVIKKYGEEDHNFCYTPEMREMYDFISTEIPKEKVVANYYPRVFRLFTGVNAIRISQYEFDLSDRADYFQNSKVHTDENVIRKYKIVFDTEHEILLSKERFQ